MTVNGKYLVAYTARWDVEGKENEIDFLFRLYCLTLILLVWRIW